MQFVQRGPMVLWIGFDSEVRRANNKRPNDRFFCSCPQRTQHLNSRCDLLTEIDMIISVRDCLQVDVNENQRLVLSRDVCDIQADRSSEKHSEVPKHLHSLLTCHTSSAHYVHSWILHLRNGIWKCTVEGLNCVPQVLHPPLSPVAQFKPQI